MDRASIAALRHYLGDDATVHPYGDGVLVDLPMRYGDGEGVRLLVEPVGDGYRVTDRGDAADRLFVTEPNPDSTLISGVLANVARVSRPDEISVDQGELSVQGTADELGRMIMAVACASLRVDELWQQEHFDQPTQEKWWVLV